MTTPAPPVLTWIAVVDYAATRDIHRCLYVFRNPAFGERPYYIGKAKRLGGVVRSRYNPGYGYLVDGLLLAGFSLFVAELTESQFENAVHFEEYLIQQWNPCRNKRRGKYSAWPVTCQRLW